MANKDSTKSTLIVAVILCLVCGIFVAGAAVSLRPLQDANRKADLQLNILKAAGEYNPDQPVSEQFEKTVEVRLVDINTGRFIDQNPDNFNLSKALKSDDSSVKIDKMKDYAGIGRRENIERVYLFNDTQGNLKSIVLPVRGKGLWSTMWGLIAIENDFNTVTGFTFYQHAETPGLGGEVDNPKWKSQWPGKVLYNDQGDLQLTVYKAGGADTSNNADVDGLSGATLTTNGVNGTIKYWLGKNGFEAFLKNLKAGEA